MLFGDLLGWAQPSPRTGGVPQRTEKRIMKMPGARQPASIVHPIAAHAFTTGRNRPAGRPLPHPYIFLTLLKPAANLPHGPIVYF